MRMALVLQAPVIWWHDATRVCTRLHIFNVDEEYPSLWACIIHSIMSRTSTRLVMRRKKNWKCPSTHCSSLEVKWYWSIPRKRSDHGAKWTKLCFVSIIYIVNNLHVISRKCFGGFKLHHIVSENKTGRNQNTYMFMYVLKKKKVNIHIYVYECIYKRRSKKKKSRSKRYGALMLAAS